MQRLIRVDMAVYDLDQFVKSGLSLAVCRDDAMIFSSNGDGLEPLVKYLYQHGATKAGVVVFDKLVGRAAALLITLLTPKSVHAGAVSDSGAEVIDNCQIPFETKRRVKYLTDVASEGGCRWEKMAIGKTAEELLSELRAVYSHLSP